jgi:CYTH domain-containing protein
MRFGRAPKVEELRKPVTVTKSSTQAKQLSSTYFEEVWKVLAEVEFTSRQTSEDFEHPDWLGEEVTDDVRYKNQSLAQRGAPNG